MDVPCRCKQCRFRSVSFFRSQLVWICTVCHSVGKFVSTTCIKQSDWQAVRSGCGILIYSAWQGLKNTEKKILICFWGFKHSHKKNALCIRIQANPTIHHLCHVKWKNAFEHVQNVQIIKIMTQWHHSDGNVSDYAFQHVQNVRIMCILHMILTFCTCWKAQSCTWFWHFTHAERHRH